MTIEGIQAALASMFEVMTEKGVVTPTAALHIRGNGRFVIHADCKYGHKPFGGKNYFVMFGTTPDKAIDAANAYIASLPDAKYTAVNEYMRKVAAAIDTGANNWIDDKYVAPLRDVTKAMTDNLLTHDKSGVDR